MGPEYEILTSLLDERFAVATAVPRLMCDQLFPEERDYISGAVAKRRADFGTGRVCARRALAQLGINPFPILPNADRSPRWPPGVVGSISHTEGICIAAATRSSKITGFGVDVERGVAAPEALQSFVCTDQERIWIGSQPASKRRMLHTLLFSAKEAFYKCQYNVTGAIMNFMEVEIRLDLVSGTFVTTRGPKQNDLPDSVYVVQGRFACSSDLVLTSAILEA